MCLQSLQQDIEVKVSFKAVGNPLNYLIRADAADVFTVIPLVSLL